MPYVKQSGQTSKKIISGVLAGAVLAGSIVAASFRLKPKETGDSVSTTISTTAQPVDETLKQLKLIEDFDINDTNAVRKRAQEIYDVSEKKVPVDEIVNIIYMVNLQPKLLIIPEGVSRAKYINSLFVLMAELLNDNVVDCANKQAYLSGGNLTDIEPNYDGLIFSYMLMASGQKDNNMYYVTKQDAINYAKIVREQLNNIRDGKVDQFSSTAIKYYDLLSGLINRTGKSDDATNVAGYTYALLRDTDGKTSLFTPYLTKDQQAFLDKNSAETYNASLEGSIYEILNISKDDLIKEGIEVGKFGNDVPNYGEKYNNKDSVAANNNSEAKVENTSEKVDEGGKHVNNSGGSSSQINVPTTKVSEETSVATPSGGGTHEEIVDEGGKAVGEVEATVKEFGEFGHVKYSDSENDLSKTK